MVSFHFELVVPADTSRLDLLNEAQALAPDLINQSAIYADRLQKWSKDPAFTEKLTAPLKLRIDGNVAGSLDMSRLSQESRGWNNNDLRDLAAAHQAYLIVTGGGKICLAAIQCGLVVVRSTSMKILGSSSTSKIMAIATTLWRLLRLCLPGIKLVLGFLVSLENYFLVFGKLPGIF